MLFELEHLEALLKYHMYIILTWTQYLHTAAWNSDCEQKNFFIYSQKCTETCRNLEHMQNYYSR